MTSTASSSRQSPRWLYKVGLLLSLAYCLTAGVLGLWLPAQNGVDLSVCYVAGTTAMRGSSPYSHDELTSTRRSLDPTLAAKPSYPFAYPPSVIPACALLSLLPWQGAQALWKLLNLMLVLGSVLLTLRLFSGLALTLEDGYLVWSFVFIFSPTVSVLLVGQSSLFVLFTALLTMVLYQLDKPRSAGLSLALALTKPHLAFPLACLLLFRRQYTTMIIAIAAFGLLAAGGFYIGHSDVHTYMQGLSRYASWNSGANPRHVGLQNLFTGVLGLAASVGSVLSVSCGLVFLGITLALDSKVHCRARTEDVLPVVLLVSVLAFGAHSYDLVLLIPVFVWAMGRRREDRRYLPMVILCFLLIVPLGAVTIAYEAFLSKLVPLAVFKVVIEPFRSWILLVMFVLSVYLTYRRVGQPRQGGRATT